MWYRRITEFKDVDPPQSMNQSQIRKLRDAPAVFGQSSFKSIVIGPPAPSEDMSDSRKRKLEHVQDDDITRFKRVRVLSKKTRVRRTKPGPETFIRFATQSEYQQTENNIASVLSNQNVISVSPTRTLARPIILPPLPAHFQSVLPFKPLDAQKNAFGYREVVKQKVLNSDELISNKTWLDVHARAGSMSLTRAAKDGNVSLVSALLRHGADPNPPLANGQTALGLAAEEGHHEVVDILLKNGAFRTTNIPQAEAALLAAAINGKVTVVDLLLESGVCFSIRDFFGRTILHRAAWNGHRRVAELLLLKGANIDAKDTYGQSALHKAAACGEEDVVRLLLVSKADIKIRDFDGYTASDRAIANGFDAIAEALNTFIAEG